MEWVLLTSTWPCFIYISHLAILEQLSAAMPSCWPLVVCIFSTLPTPAAPLFELLTDMEPIIKNQTKQTSRPLFKLMESSLSFSTPVNRFLLLLHFHYATCAPKSILTEWYQRLITCSWEPQSISRLQVGGAIDSLTRRESTKNFISKPIINFLKSVAADAVMLSGASYRPLRSPSRSNTLHVENPSTMQHWYYSVCSRCHVHYQLAFK